MAPINKKRPHSKPVLSDLLCSHFYTCSIFTRVSWCAHIRYFPEFPVSQKATSPSVFRKISTAQAQQHIFSFIPCVLPLSNYTPPLAYAAGNFTPSLPVNTIPYFSCQIYGKKQTRYPFSVVLFTYTLSLPAMNLLPNLHKIPPHSPFPCKY